MLGAVTTQVNIECPNGARVAWLVEEGDLTAWERLGLLAGFVPEGSWTAHPVPESQQRPLLPDNR